MYESRIPSHLSPEDKGAYWAAECPQCKRKTLFLYHNSVKAICNRLNNCVYTANYWDLPGADRKRLIEEHFGGDSDGNIDDLDHYVVDTSKDITVDIKWALGRRDPYATELLDKRIPDASYDKLFSSNLVGSTKRMPKIGKNDPRWLCRKGYRLLTPLYNIRSGKIVSAQTRFCPSPELPEPGLQTRDGKPMKTRSLKGCPYGPGGATFGSMEKALAQADKEAIKNNTAPSLIIAEGDIDYLTLRAIGYRNVIGVPGAPQARNVAKHLESINWKGLVYLSLDGDNAGEKSVESFCKLIKSDDIVVMNARPHHCDINDAYRAWDGADAIARIFEYARPVNKKYNYPKGLFDDKDRIKLQKLGLWSRTSNMPTNVKDRYLNTIKGTGGSSSPLKALARAATCKEYKELEMFYKSGCLPKKVGFKTRVAETPGCRHCLDGQWNLVVANFILENWPDHLRFLTIPFEPGNIQDALSKKKEICEITRIPYEYRHKKNERADYGQSLCILIDVMRSHLVVITGEKDKEDIVLSVLRSYKALRPVRKERLMRDYIMPAYLSYGEYIVEKGKDFEHVLINDSIMTTQFQRYTHRSALPLPTQKETRLAVREKRREQFEKLKEEARDPDGYSLFVTFRERNNTLKKLIAISWKSISYDNIVKKDVFDKDMNFDPKDPLAGNFLDSDHNAPKPVRDIITDFYWMQYNEPPDLSKIPGFNNEKDEKPKKSLKDMTDEEWQNTMIKWAEAGYNPDIHPFLPATVPISWIKNPPDHIKFKDPKDRKPRFAISHSPPTDPPPF